MASVDNFPYQVVIGASEIWVFNVPPEELDVYTGNQFTDDIGYVPDPRATGTFYSAAKRMDGSTVINQGSPLDEDGHYYLITHPSPTTFRVDIMDSDDTIIDTAILNTSQPVNGKVNFDCYNFFCTVGSDGDGGQLLTSIGIAVRYVGTVFSDFVSRVDGCLFTRPETLAIFKDIADIRNLNIDNSYGTVINVLAESSDFRITNLPTTIYTNLLEWGDEDKHYDKQVIPIDDNAGTYDLNAGFIEFLSQHDYYKDLNPYSLSTKFHTYYNDIGSDMLRRNADGKFTNGADLNQNNLVFPTGDGETLDIPFSGGKIQLKTNQTGVRRQVNLLDAQGNIIDSAALNYPTSGGASNVRPGSVRMDPAYPGDMSVFLAKAGNNFYLVSLRQYQNLINENGQTINFPGTMGNVYQGACYYSIIHKFNENANTILDNASQTKIDYDPEHIDENSPEASTGDDQTDNYDRESQWRRGDGAGSNEGIRHNGSDIINASDLEQSASDETPHGSSPPESGPNRIITPLNSGAIKAFIVNDPDLLSAFMGELNSDDFGTLITKYFSNPMDVFISLHRCITPAITATTSKYLSYGLWTSQHALPVLDQEKYDVFMGYINLREYCNSYKDYPPFCNYFIYLPYIGIRPIDGKIVAGKEISLYYHIDVLTGDILAELRAYNASSGHEDTCYYWTGNTLAAMPLKSTDYSSMISGLISTVVGIGTAAATGNVLGALPALSGAKGGIHPDISLIGTVTGSTTFCMPGQPYIIREMPQEGNKYPLNYNRLQGRPSNLGSTIGNSYSATSNRYLIFSESDLVYIYNTTASATEDELLELKRLLMEGVYV